MEGRSDLTRTTLAVLFVAGLIAACFWILRPFLPAVIWATTLVVATWPLMIQVQRRLWNVRGLAVAVMTLALLLVFVVPFWLAFTTIADNFERIVEWGSSLASFKLPPPPDWLTGVPLFGERAALFWESVAAGSVDALVAKAAPYAGGAATWFVAALGGLGIVFVQFLLTVVIAAIMYVSGEDVAAATQRFGYRLAGERGRESVLLAGQAIRSVALGVVVTALAQSILGGIGLALAGVPFAAVLTAVMFMLCIAQFVLERRIRVGNVSPGLYARRRQPRQHPAPNTNEKGCSPAAGPAPRRGHRRPDRLWAGRYFPRSCRIGSRIHLAPVMDRRGNNFARPSCDTLTRSWALVMRRV